MEPEPSRRRAALFGVLANYSATAFGVVTGLVLVPLYLRYFGMGTYGAWLASGGVVAMLGIVDGGLSQVVAQRMATCAGSHDRARFSETCGSGWALGLATVLLLAGAGIGASHWVPLWIHAHPRDVPALRLGFVLASLGTALSLAQRNVFSYAFAWQRTGFAGIASVCSLAGGVVATLVGLWSGLGVVALGLAMLVRGIVGAGMAAAWVWRDWRALGLPRPRLQRAELATQIRLTLPLFAGRTGGVLLANSEAAIASAFIDPAAAAVLALTGKVYGVVQSLVNPIAGATNMGLAHLAASSQPSRVRDVVGELFDLSAGLAGAGLGVALAMNGSFLNLWVGPRAYGGLALSFALCVVTAITTRLNLLGMVLGGLGVFGRPALVSLGELVARLGLLYVLLPRLGMISMPMAAMAAMAATSSWILPSYLGGCLRTRPPETLRLMLRGLWPLALSIALGLFCAFGLGRLLTPPTGWRGFVSITAAVASLVGATVWLSSGTTRQIVRRGLEGVLSSCRRLLSW